MFIQMERFPPLASLEPGIARFKIPPPHLRDGSLSNSKLTWSCDNTVFAGLLISDELSEKLEECRRWLTDLDLYIAITNIIRNFDD